PPPPPPPPSPPLQRDAVAMPTLLFRPRGASACGGPRAVLLPVAISALTPLALREETATTVDANPVLDCTFRKTFCPEAGKTFCGLPPDRRFRPWQ
ncbi:hypothetical protein, partial [Escherichia coli]|uniref:hypothetical protein n=1 Tax=Escherichia coli TaxID=562 RepID=UPI001BAF280B